MAFSKTLILVGAYNRTYFNEADLLIDWLGGKDFKVLSGPYCPTALLETLKNLSLNLIQL